MPATTVAASATGLPINRARLERIIDNLIDLLDATEPDPDLESYLGDETADIEGDDADMEPSLGWTTTMAHANSEDLEDDFDSGCADWDGMVEQWGGLLQSGGFVE